MAHCKMTELLTGKQIGKRLNMSERQVKRLWKNYCDRKKCPHTPHGDILGGSTMSPLYKEGDILGGQTLGSDTLAEKSVRLHAQMFRIEILSKDFRYEALRVKSNEQNIRGHKVLLHEKCVVIYPKDDAEFKGKDVDEALGAAASYWDGVIKTVQDRLWVSLLKDGAQNVRVVTRHVAHENHPFANHFFKTGCDYRLVAQDGKLRWVVDRSKGFPELEAVHPKSSVDDSRRFSEQMDYQLDPENATLKDVVQILIGTNRAVQIIANALASQIDLTTANTASVINLTKAIAKMNGLSVDGEDAESESDKLKHKKVKPEYVG